MILQILPVWAAIASMVGALAAALGYLLRLRRKPQLFTALLAAISALAALYLHQRLVPPTPCKVEILSPASGTEVPRNTLEVRGTVWPPAARVTLVVSSETDGRWWVQEIVRPEGLTQDGRGKWVLKAYLGASEEGIDQNFYLIALASADNPLRNALTGRSMSGNRPQLSAPSWSQSEVRVVRRVR